MTENFKILVDRLNIFRKRYYSYKLLRGLLITSLISLVLYTFISLVEYFAYLPSIARTFIFYSGIFLFLTLLFVFILSPAFHLLKILRQISYEDINQIISKHFPEIQDKLLNIIQLSKLNSGQYSNELVWASIDQKIKKIKVFDFQKSINFSQLRYFLLYIGFSSLVVIGILIFDKPLITDSNYRILNYSREFQKPAPFTFKLVNDVLKVNKGEAYTIKVKCEGNVLPQVSYINIGGNIFLMKKVGLDEFEYYIESVINGFDFYFTDLKYNSNHYTLEILPKPGITGFMVDVIPPTYTNLNKTSFENIGDLNIPEGTKVEWAFGCIDTDSLKIRFQDGEIVSVENNKVKFTAHKQIFKTGSYSISIKNKYVGEEEVLSYNLTVIPDLYPEIKVVQMRDSIQYSRFYFKGDIADDYGFDKLEFHINVNQKDTVFPLDFTKGMVSQDFFYTVDFNLFDFGDNEVNYYFQVSDNDRINGSKSTTSNSFIYKAPTAIELAKRDDEQFSKIQDMVNESQTLANEIKKGLEELKIKSLDSKVSNWEKSQLVNEILNKNDQLENLAEQVKEQNKDLNNLLKSYSKQDKEVIEKQEMIEKLLDEVFTDEMKKLMEEFSKLAQEFNKNNFNKMSEQLNMSVEDLSKQLDRNLEMLRKMKVEQRLQEVIKEIYKLTDEEKKLAEDFDENKKFEEISGRDKEINEAVNAQEERLKEILELNNELKKPLNFDDFKEEFDLIDQNFQDNQDNLAKKNRKRSSETLKTTSENMNNLAYNMDQMLKSNKMKQNMENLENLRQILSNLIHFSFSQEGVMAQLKGIDQSDPYLNSLKREQKNLRDQSAVISDSLYALAKRVPEITNMVNQELLTMDIYLLKTGNDLDEGLVPNARVNQQLVMTAVNNLALMLNDAIEQLEEQAAGNMEGDQQCENPGNKPGGKNLDMLQQSSESIKQQLQKMIEQMKSGNTQNMSQQMGESLMQHEMMQQLLRDIMDNGSVGSESRSVLQNIDKMLDETRKELINKSISEKTLIRQNQIMTRLLEAEKAEIERDFDEKRESQTADDEFYSNPVKYFEYNQKEGSELENLEYNIFKLNDFYNKKYKKYLNTIDGR